MGEAYIVSPSNDELDKLCIRCDCVIKDGFCIDGVIDDVIVTSFG